MPATTAAGLTPQNAFQIYADLCDVVQWVQLELADALPALLGLPEDELADESAAAAGSAAPRTGLRHECAAALREGAAAISRGGERLKQWLVDQQTAACTAVLAPVRGRIAAAYRMTGKQHGMEEDEGSK